MSEDSAVHGPRASEGVPEAPRSGAAVLKAEQRSLRAYMYAMLVLSVVGFVVYAVSGVAATQLDGVISLINAGAAFLAIRLAAAATRSPDEQNPYGRLALENLYAMFRSLMIAGVIVVGLVTNVTRIIQYLVTGEGSEPDFGIAAVYTAAVSIVCFALMANHLRNNRAVGNASALLRVEAHAARMEGVISAGICASLVLVVLLPEGTVLTSETFSIKMIADSLIVVVLCLVLLRDPVGQIRTEFRRLSGVRGDADVEQAVRTAIADVDAAHGAELSHRLTLVDAVTIKRGKVTEVDLHVSFDGAMTVAEQDAVRVKTWEELAARLGPVQLRLAFTAKPIHWMPPDIAESI